MLIAPIRAAIMGSFPAQESDSESEQEWEQASPVTIRSIALRRRLN